MSDRKRRSKSREPTIHRFHAKVIGVTEGNTDGINRQDILRGCEVGERLRFEHEPKNPDHSFAIAVFNARDHQLGYLHENLAEKIVRGMNAGSRYTAKIVSL